MNFQIYKRAAHVQVGATKEENLTPAGPPPSRERNKIFPCLCGKGQGRGIIFVAAFISVMLVISSGFWAVNPCSNQSKKEAVKLNEAGKKFVPDIEKAADCFTKAVSKCPDYGDAWYNLGRARMMQGHAEKAEEALMNCIKNDPNLAEAYFLLGQLKSTNPNNIFSTLKYYNLFIDKCEKSSKPCKEKDLKEAKEYVYQMESRISKSLGAVKIFTKDDITKDKLITRFTSSATRGASPYDGPRIPMRIEFDTEKANINPEYLPILDKVAEAMQEPALSGKIISIEGHADSRGDADFNMNLSEERAESVRQYLQKKLHDNNVKLITKGFGEERPLVPNDGEENWQKNRRVEFVNVDALNRGDSSQRGGEEDPVLGALYEDYAKEKKGQ